MTRPEARLRRARRVSRDPAGGVAAVVFSVLLAAPTGASTQQPAATPAAARAQRVPVTFSDFHTAAVMVDWLKRVAASHPGLTELVEIGRSAGDQPIFVLVVSNMRTGVTPDALVPLQHPRTPAVKNAPSMKPYQGKPGQWIDGGQQGVDRAGPEACLYIIDKLLTLYGNDPEITRLVNDNVFYICPLPNPDRRAAAVQAAARKDAETRGNFPEGWWKDDNTPGGTGIYPSSFPEARATLEFFTDHPNILLVQSFDATGGRSLRPFARWPDSRIDARDLAVLDRVIGKKYLELVGEPVPASWSAPAERTARGAAAPAVLAAAGGGRRGAAAGAQAAGGGRAAGSRSAEQARGWRSPYDRDRQAPAGFGVFIDWAYGQFGAFAMSTGLTDPERDAGGMMGERLLALCDTAWQFERFKASLLPHLEIKEAAAKVLYATSQATPASATESGNAGVIEKRGMPGRRRVVHVTATIENTGMLPTAVAAGPQLRGNQEDVIWLLGERAGMSFLQGSAWTRLGVLQGTIALPAGPRETASAEGGGRGGAPQVPLGQTREQRPAAAARQAGSSRTVSWVVAVEGDAPLRLVLTSLKGGTVVKDLAIE